jgi:hypothetical protein
MIIAANKPSAPHVSQRADGSIANNFMPIAGPTINPLAHVRPNAPM